MPMADVIQVRRDTAALWTTINPILAEGEFGYERDTGKLKMGDGTSTWTALDYTTFGSSSPTFTGTLTAPTINASTALQIGGTAVTSTAAELNILDGVTSTAAELNKLDGVTATTAELNYVDGVTSAIQTQIDNASTSLTDLGVTSTAAELNALDGIPAGLTATELGYVDGVTSAIQTQIDAKAPTANPTFTGTLEAPVIHANGATALKIDGVTVTSNAGEINKLDALSRGSILYGNASGATTVLTKGTSDQVLTSDGTDIAWAAAGGGGGGGGAWTYLETVTADDDATIDLTDFSSTYDNYALICCGIQTESNSDLQIRLRTATNWQTGGYYSHCNMGASNSSNYNGRYVNNGSAIEIGNNVRAYAETGADFTIMLYGATVGVIYEKRISILGSYSDTSSVHHESVGMGRLAANGSLTGCRIMASTGDIAEGVFRLYGIANS